MEVLVLIALVSIVVQVIDIRTMQRLKKPYNKGEKGTP